MHGFNSGNKIFIWSPYTKLYFADATFDTRKFFRFTCGTLKVIADKAITFFAHKIGKLPINSQKILKDIQNSLGDTKELDGNIPMYGT